MFGLNPNPERQGKKDLCHGYTLQPLDHHAWLCLNVNTGLDYFNHIIPCGIQNKQVTSIEKETGIPADLEEVKAVLKQSFEKVFDAELISG